MGVDGLKKAAFVKAYMKMVKLCELSGKRFALDSSAFMVLFIYGLLEHERNKFLIRAKNLIQLFRKHKIHTVWVFEGRKPAWKYDENKHREEERKRKREAKLLAEEKLEQHQEKRKKLEFELEQLIHREPDEQTEEIIQVRIEITLLPIAPEVEEAEPGSAVVSIQLNLYVDSIIITEKVVEPGEIREEEEKKEDQRRLLLERDLESMDLVIEQSVQAVTDKTREFIDIRPEDWVKLKELLTFMKVPWFVSEYEADYEFGAMIRSGVIDGTFANDSDLLFYGSDLAYVHGLSDLMHNEEVEYYPIKPILNGLKFTQQTFMDMCFCIDTDYRKSGLNGIGIKTIAEEITKHGSVENMIKHLITKREGAIQDLIRKNKSYDENIEKAYEVIATHQAKKNPNTKTSLTAIEKAESKIAENEMKKVIQVPENLLEIEKLKMKIEDYREFWRWYVGLMDIQPKIAIWSNTSDASEHKQLESEISEYLTFWDFKIKLEEIHQYKPEEMLGIRDKVLCRYKDNTYNIQWSTLTNSDFTIPDLTNFLQQYYN